jgi:hypothetical protein
MVEDCCNSEYPNEKHHGVWDEMYVSCTHELTWQYAYFCDVQQKGQDSMTTH